MKKITLLAAILMVVMAINVACQKDNVRAVSQTVVDLVSSAGDLPGTGLPRQDRREEVVRDSNWIEWHNVPPAGFETRNVSDVECFAFNTEWNCVTVRISAAENPDDFAMLNPLASILWPGNLVQGASLASGIPTTIPIDPSRRQPGRISLALVSSDQGGAENRMYRTVDRMSFSAVNQAMNEILAGFEGHGFAQYSFQMDFIESTEELDFKLNASFSGWGASARAGFSSNFADNRTRVLIRLHQAFFTMVFDDPPGLDGVFTSDITVNDLRNYTGNGNPICYISSVTYGRIFYLLYESTATREALSTALNFSFRGFGVEAGVDAERQFRETMEKTTARVFQIGGDASGGLTAGMALDLTAIRDFLETGANFSAENPGAPISYTVKFLKNAQLVRLNNAMEFEIEQCVSVTTENECPELPQLTTTEVMHITATSAVLGGNITNAGLPLYHERGVIFSTFPNPNQGTSVRLPGIESTGNFSGTISGLMPNTTYYVWAYAENTMGRVLGNARYFTTPEETRALPQLTTNPVTSITATSARVCG
ncbi:MAG: thiol-activated cytolysin family protein, partial [Bacteroidales bacterium]|nr:thiol-activated cytolysin family protein [Bacteroidales bacterium]